MVEATSSLPPIRYWVDVILTTVAVSAVRPNAKLLLTRKSMPVSPMLKRWWRTPLHPKGGRRSSIGAKQKHRNHAEQRGPANDPNGTARASAPGGQRPRSRNATPRASSDDDRVGGEARSARGAQAQGAGRQGLADGPGRDHAARQRAPPRTCGRATGASGSVGRANIALCLVARTVILKSGFVKVLILRQPEIRIRSGGGGKKSKILLRDLISAPRTTDGRSGSRKLARTSTAAGLPPDRPAGTDAGDTFLAYIVLGARGALVGCRPARAFPAQCEAW